MCILYIIYELYYEERGRKIQRVQAFTYSYACTYAYAYVYVHIYIYIHIHIHICIYADICVCLSLPFSVCLTVLRLPATIPQSVYCRLGCNTTACARLGRLLHKFEEHIEGLGYVGNCNDLPTNYILLSTHGNSQHLYTHVHRVFNMYVCDQCKHIYIYTRIYIYIERERDRERET